VRATVQRTCDVTLAAPDRTLEVSVPLDIAIAELMPDFAALGVGEHARPAGGEWVLAPVRGEPYRHTATLGDCGIIDGSVLVLRSSCDAGAVPPFSSARSGHRLAAALDDARPVSAHTARLLPSRLTAAQRTYVALRAVIVGGAGRSGDIASKATGIVDPAAFTLPARMSPLRRLREAWARTDYAGQLDQRILAPRPQRCATVAVVSPKGGPGKTTITALLGSLLAFLRRDRVVAVDANPDFGSLGRRLVPDHPIFIDDLLTGTLQQGPLSATGLDAQLGRGPNGLMVAPAPADPDRAKQLDEPAYRTLFERLGDFVGMLVLDCGTGLDASPARAALACADQLVLVTDGEPDTASLVCEAADWLQHSGLPLVLVVNKHERSSRLDVGALERKIPFAHGIVAVPNDRRGAEQLLASRFSWLHAPTAWRTPLRELAALIVTDWTRSGQTP
jgi:MinD-like ATPase involved in chromosome partitioning or flagellar assembly